MTSNDFGMAPSGGAGPRRRPADVSAARHPLSGTAVAAFIASVVLAAAAVATAVWMAGGGTDEDALLPPPAPPIGAPASPSLPDPVGAPASPSFADPGDGPASTPAPSASGTAAERRPTPRIVGPRDEKGFQDFLSAYCVRQGERTALLLPDGADRAKGEWACVQTVTLTPIKLDTACRESFGRRSQARQVTPGDARSWRCFDA